MKPADALAFAALIVALFSPLLSSRKLKGWHVALLCVLALIVILVALLGPLFGGPSSAQIVGSRH